MNAYVGSVEYADMDDTARLILMDFPAINMRQLHDELIRQLPALGVTPSMVGDIWRRYRGMDGQVKPTHDVETGLSLRGRW